MTKDILNYLNTANTIAYVITIITGILGNLWVAWKVGVIIVFGRAYAVPRQILYCIFSICIGDLVVLFGLLFLVHFRIHEQWIFGSVACKAFYCIEIINKMIIPLTLVQVSRFSYRSAKLKDSSRSCSRNTIRISLYLIAIASVAALMVCVAWFAETSTYSMPKGGHLVAITVCNFSPPSFFETSFNLLAFIVGYVLTSITYVYFYVNVPIVLQRRLSTNFSHSTTIQINEQALLKIRRTVTLFVVVYLCCWTPYWVLFWVLNWLPVVNRWIVIFSSFTHLLPYISCTAYPIVLTAMNQSIHRAHSTIIDSKRRQFTTIRRGALQSMIAHMGVVHSWIREVPIQKPTDSLMDAKTNSSVL